MLAPLLHVAAFLICLNVQYMGSPLAGAWLFFHIAGCAVLLYNRKRPNDEGLLWHINLAWLITLGVSTLLINPVGGGAAMMWVLGSTPSLALCLRKEDLKGYAWGFGGCILLYAAGLVLQAALNTQYSTYTLHGRRAWPLMDPNNGAAVLNLLLIPAIHSVLHGKLKWTPVLIITLAAMWITGSKAGFSVCGLATFAMLVEMLGLDFFIAGCAIGAIFLGGCFIYRADLILLFWQSVQDRMPIWQGAVKLMLVRPWSGLGMGMFGFYYQQVRTEQYTGGYFAHNDVLQLAVEIGIPMACVCALWLAAMLAATRRCNLVSGLCFLAVTLQAMVEFQFYVPAVAMPLGLVAGWHIINRHRDGLAALKLSVYGRR